MKNNKEDKKKIINRINNIVNKYKINKKDFVKAALIDAINKVEELEKIEKINKIYEMQDYEDVL